MLEQSWLVQYSLATFARVLSMRYSYRQACHAPWRQGMDAKSCLVMIRRRLTSIAATQRNVTLCLASPQAVMHRRATRLQSAWARLIHAGIRAPAPLGRRSRCLTLSWPHVAIARHGHRQPGHVLHQDLQQKTLPEEMKTELLCLMIPVTKRHMWRLYLAPSNAFWPSSYC